MKALKRLILVGMLAMIGGSAVAYQPAIREHQRYYYDPGYQYLVGEFIEYCDGSYQWWGEISEYSQIYYGQC